MSQGSFKTENRTPGKPPGAAATPDETIELLVAEATDDYLQRAERGESPSLDEYVRRYPQIAGILRRLLPAMRVLQDGNSRSAQSTPRERSATFASDTAQDDLHRIDPAQNHGPLGQGPLRPDDSFGNQTAWPADSIHEDGHASGNMADEDSVLDSSISGKSVLDSAIVGKTKAGRNGEAQPTQLGRLGDFRLNREIGRGGMGVVYEAEQVSLSRRVALKVLPMAAALDPRQLQRFRLEAQAAAHLHHAHIVPIHSIGCERGVYYYAMPLVEGRSLAEVIAQLQRNEPLADVAASQPTRAPRPSERTAPPELTETANERNVAATLRSLSASTSAESPPHVRATYFRTVALLGVQGSEALEYAHSMGVVHRDIKPANLLLDGEGRLFVTDFGLAQLQGDSRLTMTGDLLGTLRYMSPEQIRARRGVVDHRTDIYSLGATLYEMLTLRAAFDTSDRPEMLRQIVESEPPAPRSLNPALPLDLETIVLKAMAKEPERRYATAKELAEDLQRFLEHLPITARRPTVPERCLKWVRRHRGLVATVLALLFLTTIGFAISTALVVREQWNTQAAYNSLADEQLRTHAAFEAEAAQRERAEKSFRQARQIVDFFTEVSEEELADKPDLQGLRRMLLAAALDYYQGFITLDFNDPSLQTQLAASHLRVAGILNEIGSPDEALAALERARQLQERMVRTQPFSAELQTGLLAVYQRSEFLRGGRELQLLMQHPVQEELRLSSEQTERVKQIWEERQHALDRFDGDLNADQWHDRFEELAAQEKVLEGLLDAAQSRRLRQIALQQRGVQAIADADIAETLGLTAEQQARIRPLREGTRRFMAARFAPGGKPPGGNPQEGWRQMAESLRKNREQMLEVLTDEQRARWQKLVGEPFAHKLGMPGHGPMFQRPGFHGRWRGNPNALAKPSQAAGPGPHGEAAGNTEGLEDNKQQADAKPKATAPDGDSPASSSEQEDTTKQP